MHRAATRVQALVRGRATRAARHPMHGHHRVAANKRKRRRRGSFTDVRGRPRPPDTPQAQRKRAVAAAAEAALRAAAQTKSLVRRTMGAPEEARCRNRANQVIGQPRSSAGDAAFTAAIVSRCAELAADRAQVTTCTAAGTGTMINMWRKMGGVPPGGCGPSVQARCAARAARASITAAMAATGAACAVGGFATGSQQAAKRRLHQPTTS